MIPSLLQIPSAVSDSKLHSVLPNNGKGDFTFDRSTGATRINKDGLIEEVGYFSSELVQNGDFSELGSDVVVNGDFATDSDWNKGTGWSIINGAAIREGLNSYSNIKQDGILTVGKTYKVTYTVNQGAVNGVRVNIGGVYYGDYYGVGTHTVYGKATNNADLFLMAEPLFQGSIDNVSVKQVDPNDRWTVTSSTSDNYVEFGDGEARIVLGTSSPLTLFQNSGTFKAGKQYKLVVDIKTLTSGAIKIDGAGISELFNTAGVTTRIINPTANSNIIFYRASVPADITLNSVSLVEVQGDRPRLSYDITNGVVESQPHLLLEPSATNLVSFSEDFSQISLLESTITTNNIKSPNGLIKGNLWLANATSNAKEIQEQYSVTSGTTYTESWFVKYKSLQFIQMVTTSATFGAFYGNFDLVNGTKGNSNYTNCSIEKYPDGWYRIQATQVATSTGTGRLGGLRMIASATDSRGGNITTDGTEGVYVWGHQVEANSFATSYIPTAGTVISRASETCNNSKPSVNSTEGVLFVDYASLSNSGNYRLICLSDGTTSNRLFIGFRLDTGYIYYFVIVGGSTVASHITSTTSLDFSKVAVKWKANDFALWVNGSEISTDTSGSSFSANTLNTLQMNEGDGAGFEFYGKVKGLAVYNEALTDAQLIELTS